MANEGRRWPTKAEAGQRRPKIAEDGRTKAGQDFQRFLGVSERRESISTCPSLPHTLLPVFLSAGVIQVHKENVEHPKKKVVIFQNIHPYTSQNTN